MGHHEAIKAQVRPIKFFLYPPICPLGLNKETDSSPLYPFPAQSKQSIVRTENTVCIYGRFLLLLTPAMPTIPVNNKKIVAGSGTGAFIDVVTEREIPSSI